MLKIQEKLPGLPPTLAAIAEVIGLQRTLSLAKKAGGTRLYFSKTAKPEHSLVRLVGLRAARDLANRFGGESLHVPNGRAALNSYHARTLRREGRTVREIAQTLRLSERWIQELTRGIEPGDQAAGGAAKSEGDAP